MDVHLESGAWGRAAVPSGASTGAHEAVELRDGGDVMGGKGVTLAVANVESEIEPALLGLPALEQTVVDEVMIDLDGTPNKASLGANAILAVSLAVARAASMHLGIPLYRYVGGPAARILPVPMVNILNGGKHASGPIDLQEFMVVPAGFDSERDAIVAAAEVFHSLRAAVRKRGFGTTVGDEGGFSPELPTNESALELIVDSIMSAGYEPGRQVWLALDPAASEFFREGRYFMHGCDPDGLTPEGMVDYWEGLVNRFPIVSIEDGLAEDDWEGWRLLTERLGNRIHVVGDDLFVTNPERIGRGIEERSANAVLVKLNQIGTLTETLQAVDMSHRNGWRTVVSHRSGETEDTFISDLSVAVGSGLIKTGSTCRTDRTSKYNQLLRIEEDLDAAAVFAGTTALPPGLD